jgi:hypothetical protein
MILPGFTLIHCPCSVLFTFGTGHYVWFPKRSNDTRTSLVAKPSLGDLNLGFRPRQHKTKTDSPSTRLPLKIPPPLFLKLSYSYSRILYRWVTLPSPMTLSCLHISRSFNKIPEVVDPPTRTDYFLSPRHQKASRMFSQWLTTPNARSKLPAYKILEASIERSFTPQSENG